MFRNSRWLAIVASVAVLAMVSTACAPPVAQPPAEEAPKEKVSLSFWNMPFVTQEVSPEYVLKWQDDAKTALGDYTVDDFYGPGKYKDQRDKFLLQANGSMMWRSGTTFLLKSLSAVTKFVMAVKPAKPVPLTAASVHLKSLSAATKFVTATRPARVVPLIAASVHLLLTPSPPAK